MVGFRLGILQFRETMVTCSEQRSWNSCSLPLWRFPCSNSPYRRSFGIRPSAILTTCPSQHRHHCFSNVYMLKIPAHSRTTLFGTLSCQVIPKMHWRQCLHTCICLKTLQKFECSGSKPVVSKSWVPRCSWTKTRRNFHH